MPTFEFLGPYRIGKPLGRGGMGTVFSAIHEKSGEKVAVKLIAAHVADEARFRRRFDDEVKTLQQLRHKHIVRLIGFGEEQGQLFYSMELVEGETVQARIRREKKIDWLSALNIAIEICAALKHAHDFGVIHRDLKPANLMLSNTDGVKLVDFGIAKIFGDGELTMAGSVLGTADYMAPEQATGSGVTGRTDLYALGSVMYAMLTGRPPFRGKNVTEVIESLKRDRPVPLELIDPSLPEAIVELIHQLLEKDPDLRPPTALAVMNRLKAMRAGLQREETVHGDRLATKVAIETHSHDDGSHCGIHDASTPIDRGRGTDNSNDDEEANASGRGSSKIRSVNPNDATVALAAGASRTVNPDDSQADVDDLAKSETRTHFQTVSESDRRPGFFQAESSDQGTEWTGRLSIAAMVVVLIVGGGLVLYAMRPPSADQLYEAAIIDEETGAMLAFTKRFPDDPRSSEVLNRYMQKRLAGQLKRLETQKRLGITPLKAFEVAFCAAMDQRYQQPVESTLRLKQWLVVYDSPESKLDPNLSTLIELARHEKDQLDGRAPAIIIDPRATKMIAEIRSLAEQSDTEYIRSKLTGIIETFRPIDWAKPAVEEAESQLQALEEFSDQR